MSLNIRKSIQCPKCGQLSETTVWKSITVKDSPDLKEDLLTGRVNMFRCPSCDTIGIMPYSLLYHDEDKKLMIMFVPTDDPVKKKEQLDKMNKSLSEDDELKKLEGYNLRFLTDYNELLEKILIFDNGLNDKAVEVIKLMIMSQDVDKSDRRICRFGKLENGQLEFMVYDFIEKQTYTSAVPAETYDTIYNSLIESGVKPYSFDWETVDGGYATRLLNGFNHKF